MTYRSPEPEELHWELIPWAGLRRLARRYAKGSKMRADRGEDAREWEKGLAWDSTFRHIMWHLWRYNAIKQGWLEDDGDDHLAAAAWGCFAEMHFEGVAPTPPSPTPPQEEQLSFNFRADKPIEEQIGEEIRRPTFRHGGLTMRDITEALDRFEEASKGNPAKRRKP